MAIDLTGDKPIKIRMVVVIMVIGVVASSAAGPVDYLVDVTDKWKFGIQSRRVGE